MSKEKFDVWQTLTIEMQRYIELLKTTTDVNVIAKKEYAIIEQYVAMNLTLSTEEIASAKKTIASRLREKSFTMHLRNISLKWNLFYKLEAIEEDWAIFKFLESSAYTFNPTTIHEQFFGVLETDGVTYSYYLAYKFSKDKFQFDTVELEFNTAEQCVAGSKIISLDCEKTTIVPPNIEPRVVRQRVDDDNESSDSDSEEEIVDFFENSIDFYNKNCDSIKISLHGNETSIKSIVNEIDELIENMVEKFGVDDQGKHYTADETVCCLHLHSLIFYMQPVVRGTYFPLPSYTPIPVENVSKWLEYSIAACEITKRSKNRFDIERAQENVKMLQWLQKNINNNSLDDYCPMNRRYG